MKSSSADGISQLIANEIAAHKGYTIHTAKGMLINFRSGNAAYTFTDSNGVYRGEESYPYHMVSIHLVDTRGFSNETYDKLSYEQVAEQIIKNAKAGHAESVDFVLMIDREIALAKAKSSQRCIKEWEEATEVCEDLIEKGGYRGITGNYNDVFQCAKGLVSEECGGNKVVW